MEPKLGGGKGGGCESGSRVLLWNQNETSVAESLFGRNFFWSFLMRKQALKTTLSLAILGTLLANSRQLQSQCFKVAITQWGIITAAALFLLFSFSMTSLQTAKTWQSGHSMLFHLPKCHPCTASFLATHRSYCENHQAVRHFRFNRQNILTVHDRKGMWHKTGWPPKHSNHSRTHVVVEE